MKLAALRLLFRMPARQVRTAIALGAVALGLGLQWLPHAPGTMWGDEWLRDRFLRWQVSIAPEPRILVVDIDEDSLHQLGPPPWPHARIADLVETLLTVYQSRGVALDIVLPKPDTSGEGDQRLALLAQHAPLVLAQAFDYSPDRPLPLREGEPGGASGPGTLGSQATGYLANYAALARQAAHIGNIGFIPDPDGALRRVPLLTSFGGREYPALQLALVNCCSHGPRLQAGAEPMRIAYSRDWNAYTVVSAAEVLRQSLDPQAYGGRLAIIGSSALSLGDRVATPLSGSRPGLGVQAAILSTLLDQQAGLLPAPWQGAALGSGFTILAALLAAFAFPRLSAVASVALLGALSVAWLAVAAVASAHDPALVTSAPLATNLFLLAVAVPWQWQVAQGRSRRLLETLRQYVAPAVVTELLRSDIADPLAPRQLDITTLIADMEGYTTHVEALSLEQAARLTRDFLDCLTGPVIAAGGTLDKYTGDGLVAFWGAPLPVAAHADLALEAAAAIVARVARLSEQRIAAGQGALRVRIGIESGAAMAGDFGSSFRSIYTAVGDSVNTASRLEQAARDFPYSIIVGAGTAARARRHQLLHLGQRRLRGKENAVSLYTLQDPAHASVEQCA